MQTRKPIVAGQFYPGRRDSCVAEINECLQQEALSEPLPETIVAGIVPHAGWVFSGSLAALVFSAIKQRHEKVDTFVIFGAAHGYFGQSPAVFDKGSWATPLGEVAIDEELADAVLDSGSAVSDTGAHSSEHSIEVQVPFIEYLFAEAKILPIIVPPNGQAVALGTSIAEIISADKKKVVSNGPAGSTTGSLLTWPSNSTRKVCSQVPPRTTMPAGPAQRLRRLRPQKNSAKPKACCLHIPTVMK